MMFMYVADKEKDFSAGTLYAAKFKQTSTKMEGKATFSGLSLAMQQTMK